MNSRRIPPPANVPSLKSEIGYQSPVYDPTVPVNHGWSSTTPSTDVAPTQQQLDALPVHSSAPTTQAAPPPNFSAPNSAEIDKSRGAPTWSNVTSGSTNAESIPNLLALNDFPRLATVQEQRRSSPNETNPTFRPANLSTWKEGGGNPNRIPPLMSDAPGQLMSPNQSNRMYSNSPMVTIDGSPLALSLILPSFLVGLSEPIVTSVEHHRLQKSANSASQRYR